MSDVAFLLLIFIMLVSLINYRREVNIAYPEAENPKKINAENNLEIWVDASGALYLDGDSCTLRRIEEAVVEAHRRAPDTRIHLIADRGTAFQKVNVVLGALQALQYRSVGFVVKDAAPGAGL
jgi:biopolymer transport protein ExbD